MSVDLRVKVKGLHLSGLDADLVVELIIDVVTRANQSRGGRPSAGPARAFNTPAATPLETIEQHMDLIPQTGTSNSEPKVEVCELVAKPQKTSNLSMFESYSESSLPLSLRTQEASSLVSRQSDEPLPAGFAEFWATPHLRRVQKQDAVDAWKKAAKRGELPALEVVIAAIRWQMAELFEAGTPPLKYPHPATWINGRRWENERPAQVSSVPPKHRQQLNALKSNHEYLRQRAEQMKAEGK